MKYEILIAKMRKMSNQKNISGMARFGINPKGTLGVPMPIIRGLAKELGKDHALATKLWNSGIHEARILAALVAEPGKLTNSQIDNMVNEFDSWDVCDQVCLNLFDKIPQAYSKARKWSKSKKEFVKRAGFALMAVLAVHDINAKDTKFTEFFPCIIKAAKDERNFVKKAVNWALRQIGKRNKKLHKVSISVAQELIRLESKSARWIGRYALREFANLKGYALKRVCK